MNNIKTYVKLKDEFQTTYFDMEELVEYLSKNIYLRFNICKPVNYIDLHDTTEILHDKHEYIIKDLLDVYTNENFEVITIHTKEYLRHIADITIGNDYYIYEDCMRELSLLNEIEYNLYHLI